MLEDAGLKPDPVVLQDLACEDSTAPVADASCDPRFTAMASALEAFVRTIEATGGCVEPGGHDDDPTEFDVPRPVPVGDEEWPDLADAYILACRALGREPMVRDVEPDEGGAEL